MLDAKGGIVGGTIDLNKINTYTNIWEEQGVEPHHKLGLTLAALELRLDYMGTSVLMTRISSLNAAMRDEWKCSTETGKMLPNERPTIILVHGDLSWDQVFETSTLCEFNEFNIITYINHSIVPSDDIKVNHI